MKLISKSFSRFLNDTNSLSQPTLWNTALEMFHTAKNMWSFISFEKCFLPRLVELLNNACFGNAVAIGPVVVSIVRLFYERGVSFDGAKFNRGVVQGFCKGLLSRSARGSPSEGAALCTALFQAISYMAFQGDSTNPCLDLLNSEVVSFTKFIVLSVKQYPFVGYGSIQDTDGVAVS